MHELELARVLQGFTAAAAASSGGAGEGVDVAAALEASCRLLLQSARLTDASARLVAAAVTKLPTEAVAPLMARLVAMAPRGAALLFAASKLVSTCDEAASAVLAALPPPPRKSRRKAWERPAAGSLTRWMRRQRRNGGVTAWRLATWGGCVALRFQQNRERRRGSTLFTCRKSWTTL